MIEVVDVRYAITYHISLNVLNESTRPLRIFELQLVLKTYFVYKKLRDR